MFTLKHDRATGEVTVTIKFPADAQIEKPGLVAGVIEHHLLSQAATLCQSVANARLHGHDLTPLEEEAARQKAEIDAKLDMHRTVHSRVNSDVTANPEE